MILLSFVIGTAEGCKRLALVLRAGCLPWVSICIEVEAVRRSLLGHGRCHQLTWQLDTATNHAVIGNCGTLLSFRLGLEDAELLAPAMSKHPGQLLPADLGNLHIYTAYVRLLIDGCPSRPLSLRTLPRSNLRGRRAARRLFCVRPSIAMPSKSLYFPTNHLWFNRALRGLARRTPS